MCPVSGRSSPLPLSKHTWSTAPSARCFASRELAQASAYHSFIGIKRLRPGAPVWHPCSRTSTSACAREKRASWQFLDSGHAPSWQFLDSGHAPLHRRFGRASSLPPSASGKLSHGSQSVEDTKLSTNKQHSLSRMPTARCRFAEGRPCRVCPTSARSWPRPRIAT
jgi:hypothetical protein